MHCIQIKFDDDIEFSIEICFLWTLKELHLNNNKIGSNGAEYLSDALEINTVRIVF